MTKTATKTLPDVKDIVDALMQSDVTFFPVRHHSPIVARHLKQLIHDKKPKFILVEMPTSAEWLIPHIIDTDTKPPVAIYSYFTDKKNTFGLNGVLSPSDDIPAKFDTWYPMLEYSPEFVAMKEGSKIKADIKFVDLPFRELIQFKFDKSKVPKNTSDEGLYEKSPYVDSLLKKFHFRDERELWDFLELECVDVSTEKFLEIMYYYCTILRMGVPDELLEAEGTFHREKYMRQCLDECLLTCEPKDILVVTGSFHSIALPFTKTDKKMIKVKIDPDESTLTPFSFFQLSDMSGYASGNPAPKYYQRLWTLGDHDKVAHESLVNIMNIGFTKGEVLSIADTIGASNNAINLSRLRMKKAITRVEILDSVDLNYMRGRDHEVGKNVMEAVFKVMVGGKVGHVTDKLGKLAIVIDFYDRIKKLRLPLEEGIKKNLKLDLYKQPIHKQKSHFLHQLSFLNVPYARYLKGPNVATQKDMHLIVEQWEVMYRSMGCESTLTGLAGLGTTVEDCAVAKMKEEIATVKGDTIKFTELMLRSAQMGLKDLFNDLLKDALTVISNESDFVALVKSLYNFISLYSYRGVTMTKNHALMLTLIERTYLRGGIQVSTIIQAKDDVIKDVVDAIRGIIQAQMTFKEIQLDKNYLVRFVKASIVQNINATVHGALMGGLHLMKEADEDAVLKEFNKYALGTVEQFHEAGKYLEGVLLMSKNLLLTSDKMVSAFNLLIECIQWDDFKKIVPTMRRAFKVFTNREIHALSKKIAVLLGFLDEISLSDLSVSPAVIEVFRHLDAKIADMEKTWGLVMEDE